MTTLEEAKAFLKREAPDGTNLYDHLSDVLLKILVERPENLHQSFESVSASVKQEKYVAPTDTATESIATKESKQHQEAWANAALALLKLPTDEASGGASTESPPGVADMLDEAHLFEWAGLGFSSGEVFRLSVALQRLAQTQSTRSLRFWGKLLGLGVSFYVAEGELASPPDEPEESDAEALEGSTGVNRFTYWVLRDSGTYEWEQLPTVSRAQIQVARQLRRYIKGDLEGAVVGHPPFPGQEKHFLRAQIARISAGTVVAPAGYFQLNDETEDMEPVEEPELRTAAELGELSAWVHFSKEINATYARMTAMPPRLNEDGEEVPWDGEELVPALRSLAEDDAGGWRLDRFPATLVPAVGEFAVVRSLTWPGAVGIAVGKKFLNVYVGHGVKYSAKPYQRVLPQVLQAGYGLALGGESDEATDGEGGDGADGGGGGDVTRPDALRFTGLSEQPDVLEDPTPPEPEEE